MEDQKQKINRISQKLRVNDTDELTEDEKHIKMYLNPSPLCALCNSKVAFKINQDYIENGDNISLKEFRKRHADDFKKITKKTLTEEKLRLHFSHHFNAQGAAAKRYNNMVKLQEEQKRFSTTAETNSNLPASQITPELRDLFEIMEDQYINELKVMNYTLKAQLEHLRELKEIKIHRKVDNNLNIESLIMKEEEVIKNIQNVILNKVKTFQATKLQEAQTNAIENLNVMNAQAMGSLGIETKNPVLIKKSQYLFLNTVIKHFLDRLKKCLNRLSISNEEKAAFYDDLKKQLKGVEETIYTDFGVAVKDINMKDAQPVD